jgi:hypothetical protein
VQRRITGARWLRRSGSPALTGGGQGGRQGCGDVGRAITEVGEAARKRRNGVEGLWQMKFDARVLQSMNHR